MIITCGEALFDMFAGESQTGRAFGVSIDGVIGGSPLNVSLGLSRMGSQTGLFTRISTDIFGEKLSAFMKANTISDQYCVTTDQYTTLAIVSTDETGHPRYFIYTNGTADCSMEMSDIPATLGEDVEAIHLGSFATALNPSGQVLRAFARQNADRCLISFDPNIRAMVIPDMDVWRDCVDEMLPLAGIVKASDEDLSMLYPGQELEAFIARALSEGADLACVTRGPDGAIVGSADGRLVHVPGRKVDVIDTVGAGDTFQAATLHYLSAQNALKKGAARDVDISEMAQFAVNAAALTCTRRGADLPTLAQISAFAGS